MQNVVAYHPPFERRKGTGINVNAFAIGCGVNYYSFNANDCIETIDFLGLSPFCVCVRANHSHAWIQATDLATGETHTYGRWATGYPTHGATKAKTSGVNIDIELGDHEHYEASRCVLVQNFTPTINAGYNVWKNNCTTYAQSEWERVSGEDLKKSGIFVMPPTFDYPPVLENSIKQENGGKKSVGCSCRLLHPPISAW